MTRDEEERHVSQDPQPRREEVRDGEKRGIETEGNLPGDRIGSFERGIKIAAVPPRANKRGRRRQTTGRRPEKASCS